MSNDKSRPVWDDTPDGRDDKGFGFSWRSKKSCWWTFWLGNQVSAGGPCKSIIPPRPTSCQTTPLFAVVKRWPPSRNHMNAPPFEPWRRLHPTRGEKIRPPSGFPRPAAGDENKILITNTYIIAPFPPFDQFPALILDSLIKALPADAEVHHDHAF